MKIVQIETIPVQVPINPQRAIRGGRGSHTVSPFLLVKIHTGEDIIGLGEVSCTPVWSGEDQVTSAHFIAHILAPIPIGQDPTQIERLMRQANRAIAHNPFTKSAIEMALWDILGKMAAYRSTNCWVVLCALCADQVLGVRAGAREGGGDCVLGGGTGFRTMKVKVGLDPDEDVARVRAVRRAVGPDVRLGVDANGGWSPWVAIQTVQRLYEYDIYFVEQPTSDQDVAWLADVRNEIRLPVMADESVYTPQDAMSIVRANAADVLSLYVGKGGDRPGVKIAAVAEAAGLVCTVGSNLELGIANAAMIHLALATAAIDAESFPCDILSPFFYETDLLAEPLPIRAGEAYAPAGPGLGVTLDEDKVAHYRTDK